MPPGSAFSLSASTSASLADPAGSSALVAAASWLQDTLLGTVATTVAIIAVACVGLSMLSGRASVRYGATVIAGAFILFAASIIVAGIQAFVVGGGGGTGPYPPEPPPPLAVAPPAPAPASGNDPYAGASVPAR